MLYSKIIRKYPVNFEFFFITLLCVIYLYLSIPALLSPPLWDDYSFLLYNDHIVNAESPLKYWLHTTLSGRSWPLGYTILWTINAIFGSNIFWYKFFGVLFHLINACLILIIAKKFYAKLSIFSFIFFLFHPLSIETLSWGIQSLTIYSLFFMLLSFYFLFSQKGARAASFSIFFYLLSIMTKPNGALLVFILIPIYFKQIKDVKKSFYFALVLCVAALYTYKINKAGLTVRPSEIRLENRLGLNSSLELQNKSLGLQAPEVSMLLNQELSKNEFNLTRRDRFFLLLPNIANNFIFYCGKIIIPVDQMLLYPKEKKNILFVLLGFFLLALLMSGYLSILSSSYSPSKIGGPVILFSFLTVSGLYYIPQMKYSFVSDHWSYFLIFGASLTIGFVTNNIYQKYPGILKFILPVLVLLLIYRYNQYMIFFNDRTSVLNYNIENNPNMRELLEKIKKSDEQ